MSAKAGHSSWSRPRLSGDSPAWQPFPSEQGRAFLALKPAGTMADLELSVVDALERGAMDAGNRDALAEFREQLRGWRTDQSMALEPRAIIVACKRKRKTRGQRSRP